MTFSFSGRTRRAAPLCWTARSRRAGGWYAAWIGAHSTSPRARLTRTSCGCVRASQLDDSTHEHCERLRQRLCELTPTHSDRAPSRSPPSRAPHTGSACARPLSDHRTCACADLAPRIVAHRVIHRFAVFTLPRQLRCSHALMALHVPSCLSALRLCARKARLRRLWCRPDGRDCGSSREDPPCSAGWGSDVTRSVFVARSTPSTRSSSLACALYTW